MKTATKAKIGLAAGLFALEILIGGIFPFLGTKPEEPNFAYEASKKSGYSTIAKDVKPELSELVNGIPFGPDSALAEELTAELIKAEADKYFQKNDYTNAVTKYNEAISRGLTSKEDRYMSELNLGFSLIELGKSKEALPHYEAAKKLGAPFSDEHEWKGDSFNLYNEGFDYERSGDLKKAVEIYEKAQKEDPSNPTVRYEMAGVYKKMGDIEKAKELLEKNIRENPLYTGSYSSFGSLFYPDGPCEKFKYPYLISLEIDNEISPKKKSILNERISECPK